MAQTVKSLTPVQETKVQSLGGEDPLEKRITTHSSILAWRIPWREEPGGLQSMGHKKPDMTEQLTQTCMKQPLGVYVKILLHKHKK